LMALVAPQNDPWLSTVVPKIKVKSIKLHSSKNVNLRT
jgi:hypothetical protein